MVEKESLQSLLSSATKADGVEPLSEQFLLGLTDSRLGHEHFLFREDGEVVGVLAVDGDSGEMVVHPEFRRRHIATRLFNQAKIEKVWAHGNLEPAQKFAESFSLTETRRLLVMEISGNDLNSAAAQTGGYGELLNYSDSVRRFGKKEVDKQWLRVNNEAFSWHPEQGGWDIDRLHRGMEADWFHPEDVLLLWTEQDGHYRLAGFHWTKWHGAAENSVAENGAVGGNTSGDSKGMGEIYVVGLGNDSRGKGLGAPLLSAGLARMRERGAQSVILYVESDNEPAVKAYKRMGFITIETHSLYARKSES